MFNTEKLSVMGCRQLKHTDNGLGPKNLTLLSTNAKKINFNFVWYLKKKTQDGAADIPPVAVL